MLEHFELRLPREARDAVRGALPDDLRTQLSSAGPLEWLPADLHMGILAAPARVLGPESYRRLWRRLMTDAYSLPLFRSFAQGAVGVFKNLPAQIFRVVPQGFSLIARRCGDFDVKVVGGQREVRLVWAGIPSVLLKDDSFVTAWAGTLESILDLTSTRGEVVVTEVRPTSASYLVSI